MSVLSGYGKFKRYLLTNDGYKLCSQWTSSNTVHFDDGNTAQAKLGAINGITDSLTATSSNVALSAKAGKSLQDQVTQLNTDLKMHSYSITMVSNNYVSQSAVTIQKSHASYIVGIHFFLIYNIPAWSGVKIAQISDWNHPSSVLVPCMSVMDSNSYAQGTVVTITASGEVVISPHGALIANDWFYGSVVF